MNAKQRGIALRRYELGLRQYNSYFNNRDGFVEEKKERMAELSSQLSSEDVSLAEKIGIALADDSSENKLIRAQNQYASLNPTAQIYAQHKREEYEALRTIANDMEKASDIGNSVPITDYTKVKSIIKAGTHSLKSIASELPIPWQDIMMINQEVEFPRPSRKPPKQSRFHLEIHAEDEGLLEDKKAVRDGKWLISYKHNLLIPYQEPVPVYKLCSEGSIHVDSGKRVIVVTKDPGTEWETEFWRKRGYLDQCYIRSKRGQLPEQLRRAYIRRKIRMVLWISNIILLALILIILAERYVL